MNASRTFFRERRAQAVFKHGILSRYPVVFAAKTGWRGRPVAYLDGYAGRGEYEDGSPGSPLLLSEKAEGVAAFRDVTASTWRGTTRTSSTCRRSWPDAEGRETSSLRETCGTFCRKS
ncbi:hypothetical protein GCM10018954_057020 [Kutzneria kofuensis]